MSTITADPKIIQIYQSLVANSTEAIVLQALQERRMTFSELHDYVTKIKGRVNPNSLRNRMGELKSLHAVDLQSKYQITELGSKALELYLKKK